MKTLVVFGKKRISFGKIGHVEFFLVEVIMSMQSHDLKPSIRIHSLYFFILVNFWKNRVVEGAILSKLAYRVKHERVYISSVIWLHFVKLLPILINLLSY